MVRVDKLKKKLALLKLSTTGTKEELQQRIKAAMEEETQNGKVQHNLNSEVGSTRSSESIDSCSGCGDKTQMSQMLEAIQQIMLENSMQLLEMENKFQEYTQRQENLLAEQQKNLEEKLKKQQEITDGLSGKVQKLEKCLEKMQERVKYLEGEQIDGRSENFDTAHIDDKEIEECNEIESVANTNLQRDFKEEQKSNEKIGNKIQELEEKICNLRARLSETSFNTKFQPPTFDGTTSFSLFLLQFELAIKGNQWNDEDRLKALVLALKGDALTELQVLHDEDKCNYETLMNVLKRKYDTEYMKQAYRIALKSRLQSFGETLQDHAVDIERLTHLAYDFETAKDRLEEYKIDAFINGILDPVTKYAALTSPKSTLMETLANAMTHEAAAKFTAYKGKPTLDKDSLTKAIYNAIKTAVGTELQLDTIDNK